MKQNSESNENVCPGYYYYDSKLAITPEELQDLYRFTRWGRSRSLEQIEKMLEEKVNLKIWVKVKKDWRDSDTLMKNFGYNKKEI